MNKNLTTIPSLKYQPEIEKLAIQLRKKTNLKYFVCHIIFNNGQTFSLSNLFHLLEAYYNKGLHKEDFSFTKEHTANVTHYLCNQVQTITSRFQKILEEEFHVYRGYYIIRNCPECQFVFGAMKDTPFEDFDRLYKKTLYGFENFCCDFMDAVVDIIKHYNLLYATSLILNDTYYRKRIIQTSDAFKQHLTVRERECLAFAAHGKSSEETAYELGISKMTVDGYREEIKRKLEAVNITQAVFEAVKHGYLGAFDKVWSRSEETKAHKK